MKLFSKLDAKYGDSGVWQFIKFNLISCTVSLLQFALANLLPLFFDGLRAPLPVFLRGIFSKEVLNLEEGIYVINGVVSWGYVLPFFLSNLIANIYGYFINRTTTFRSTSKPYSLPVYFIVLTLLILLTTWVQGILHSYFVSLGWKTLSRTLAASCAGWIQLFVLFPLEKYVLFKKED